MNYRMGPQWSAVYDMDRVEFVRSARVRLPDPPTIMFEGGPMVGTALPEQPTLLPDFFEVDCPKGRYCPTLTTGTDGVYVWVPA